VWVPEFSEKAHECENQFPHEHGAPTRYRAWWGLVEVSLDTLQATLDTSGASLDKTDGADGEVSQTAI